MARVSAVPMSSSTTRKKPSKQLSSWPFRHAQAPTIFSSMGLLYRLPGDRYTWRYLEEGYFQQWMNTAFDQGSQFIISHRWDLIASTVWKSSFFF